MSIIIREAAKIMDVTEQFLRLALQQDKFPFGTAVKRERRVNYNNTERFIVYKDDNNYYRRKCRKMPKNNQQN